MLMVSGDIHFNPGPTQRTYKFPCGTCFKPVKCNQKGILCDSCDSWFHIKCLPETIALSNHEYELISLSDTSWFCFDCQLPLFSDSFFDQTADRSELRTSDDSLDPVDSPTDTNDDAENPNHLHLCEELRANYPKNCFFSYINVNSVRYKMDELRNVTGKLQPAVFAVAETKIDNSFHIGQFYIDGYHPPFRRDRTAHGGGLLVYVRSDIPCRKLDFATPHVESLSLDLSIKKISWNIIVAYKSPGKVSDSEFQADMELLCEKSTSLYDRTLILGDLNYNLMDPAKSKPLADLMDNFSLENLIHETTFTSQHGSSLIDVALTNNINYFQGSAVTDIGCSDGHSMITAIAKLHLPKIPPQIYYLQIIQNFHSGGISD